MARKNDHLCGSADLIDEVIDKNIRARIWQIDLSVAEIARRSGVIPKTLNKMIERGPRTIRSLEKLSRILGVPNGILLMSTFNTNDYKIPKRLQ